MKFSRFWIPGVVALGLVLILFGSGLAGRLVDLRPGTALGQGWSVTDVQRWYGAYQGSRLMPLAWFKALEQPGSEARFADDKYLAHFGYLTQPGRLPVGFAIDAQDATGLSHTDLVWKPGQKATEPWVGMTCAACHTSQIQYGDKTWRIEGGATLADFQGFIEAVNQALDQTHTDPAKFQRFADRVLGKQASDADRARLRGALDKLVAYQLQIAGMNATHARYGYGRLDAVGYIFNKVALIASPEAPTANEPVAPVSYPFLWNTSQQTHVQWNGIALNAPQLFSGGRTFDLGALGRNFGEVTGVFGDVSLAPGQHSSIEVNNLVALEQQLMRLKPPRWPRDVFPIDAPLAAEGKTLFTARCASCHMDLARDDLKTHARPNGDPIEVMSYFQPQKPGEAKADTDPWMACDAALYQMNSGVLASVAPSGQPPLGVSAPGSVMLRTLIMQVMKKEWPKLAVAGVGSFLGLLPPPQIILPAGGGSTRIPPPAPPPPPSFLDQCKQYAASSSYAAVAYKARPLTGVWATGPFLHNGSAPTLYDLLLPPAQRPVTFNLGTRRFDPKHVGFVTAAAPDNPFVFQVKAADGSYVQGNSNQGHDYGNASLSEHQRLALVEYLKIVGE
jgi:hypothetical protein